MVNRVWIFICLLLGIAYCDSFADKKIHLNHECDVIKKCYQYPPRCKIEYCKGGFTVGRTDSHDPSSGTRFEIYVPLRVENNNYIAIESTNINTGEQYIRLCLPNEGRAMYGFKDNMLIINKTHNMEFVSAVISEPTDAANTICVFKDTIPVIEDEEIFVSDVISGMLTDEIFYPPKMTLNIAGITKLDFDSKNKSEIVESTQNRKEMKKGSAIIEPFSIPMDSIQNEKEEEILTEKPELPKRRKGTSSIEVVAQEEIKSTTHETVNEDLEKNDDEAESLKPHHKMKTTTSGPVSEEATTTTATHKHHKVKTTTAVPDSEEEEATHSTKAHKTHHTTTTELPQPVPHKPHRKTLKEDQEPHKLKNHKEMKERIFQELSDEASSESKNKEDKMEREMKESVNQRSDEEMESMRFKEKERLLKEKEHLRHRSPTETKMTQSDRQRDQFEKTSFRAMETESGEERNEESKPSKGKKTDEKVEKKSEEKLGDDKKSPSSTSQIHPKDFKRRKEAQMNSDEDDEDSVSTISIMLPAVLSLLWALL